MVLNFGPRRAGALRSDTLLLDQHAVEFIGGGDFIRDGYHGAVTLERRHVLPVG